MSNIRVKSISISMDSPEDFKLEFIGSEEDGPIKGEPHQAALKQVQAEIQEAGFDAIPTVGIQKAVGFGSWLMGSFIFKAGGAALFTRIFLKPLTPIIIAWIGARAGRKVRLKKGDIEVEAATAKEAERLFELLAGNDTDSG